MKIAFGSDIHNEFSVYITPQLDVDVYVFTGDLGTKLNGVKWAIEESARLQKPFIIVPGNHDFWKCKRFRPHIDKMKTLAKNARESGLAEVYVLYNDVLTINDVTFLGTTLWTNFKLLGNQPLAMYDASQNINDFNQIRWDVNSRFTPNHVLIEHDLAVDFLTENLINKPLPGKKVVLTHFAPTGLSEKVCKDGSTMPSYYASNLMNLVGYSEASYWIHGHTHNNVEYDIGDTKVIAHMRGYVNMYVVDGDNGDVNFVPRVIEL